MANIYNEGKAQLASGGATDFVADDIRALLVAGTYTYNPDHTFVSDLTGELTNPGYARVALTSKAGPTKDNTLDSAYCTFANVTFTSLGAGSTPAAMIVFRHTGLDATAPLLSHHVLTAPNPPNGGNYTINAAALTTGAIRLNDA
jgi:hypothetical protein